MFTDGTGNSDSLWLCRPIAIKVSTEKPKRIELQVMNDVPQSCKLVSIENPKFVYCSDKSDAKTRFNFLAPINVSNEPAHLTKDLPKSFDLGERQTTERRTTRAPCTSDRNSSTTARPHGPDYRGVAAIESLKTNNVSDGRTYCDSFTTWLYRSTKGDRRDATRRTSFVYY